MSVMTSHRILITAEYLNAHFFSLYSLVLMCLCTTSVILWKFS